MHLRRKYIQDKFKKNSFSSLSLFFFLKISSKINRSRRIWGLGISTFFLYFLNFLKNSLNYVNFSPQSVFLLGFEGRTQRNNNNNTNNP